MRDAATPVGPCLSPNSTGLREGSIHDGERSRSSVAQVLPTSPASPAGISRQSQSSNCGQDLEQQAFDAVARCELMAVRRVEQELLGSRVCLAEARNDLDAELERAQQWVEAFRRIGEGKDQHSVLTSHADLTSSPCSLRSFRADASPCSLKLERDDEYSATPLAEVLSKVVDCSVASAASPARDLNFTFAMTSHPQDQCKKQEACSEAKGAPEETGALNVTVDIDKFEASLKACEQAVQHLEDRSKSTLAPNWSVSSTEPSPEQEPRQVRPRTRSEENRTSVHVARRVDSMLGPLRATLRELSNCTDALRKSLDTKFDSSAIDAITRLLNTEFDDFRAQIQSPHGVKELMCQSSSGEIKDIKPAFGQTLRKLAERLRTTIDEQSASSECGRSVQSPRIDCSGRPRSESNRSNGTPNFLSRETVSWRAKRHPKVAFNPGSHTGKYSPVARETLQPAREPPQLVPVRETSQPVPCRRRTCSRDPVPRNSLDRARVRSRTGDVSSDVRKANTPATARRHEEDMHALNFKEEHRAVSSSPISSFIPAPSPGVGTPTANRRATLRADFAPLDFRHSTDRSTHPSKKDATLFAAESSPAADSFDGNSQIYARPSTKAELVTSSPRVGTCLVTRFSSTGRANSVERRFTDPSPGTFLTSCSESSSRPVVFRTSQDVARPSPRPCSPSARACSPGPRACSPNTRIYSPMAVPASGVPIQCAESLSMNCSITLPPYRVAPQAPIIWARACSPPIQPRHPVHFAC